MRVIEGGLSSVRAEPSVGVRDLVAAERAAGDFLRALGVPLDRAGLAATPRRMAHAYAELLTPQEFEPTAFPNEDG